jgi:hypothetical protein
MIEVVAVAVGVYLYTQGLSVFVSGGAALGILLLSNRSRLNAKTKKTSSAPNRKASPAPGRSPERVDRSTITNRGRVRVSTFGRTD